jgi:predicted HAD superfamily phosphohydrolase
VDTGTAVAFTTTEGTIPEASVSISSPKTTSA